MGKGQTLTEGQLGDPHQIVSTEVFFLPIQMSISYGLTQY